MPSVREFAGALNQYVSLESPGETSGDAVVTWTTVGNDWAQMLGVGGTEISGAEATADYRFRFRYRTDITARWRIGVGSRKFNVVTPPQDPDGLGKEIIVTAREIV